MQCCLIGETFVYSYSVNIATCPFLEIKLFRKEQTTTIDDCNGNGGISVGLRPEIK